MLSIKLKHFETRKKLNTALKDLLVKHMQLDEDSNHAMMLSGGSTPLPVYDQLSKLSVSISEKLHIFYSDERSVPSNSSNSNYGNSKSMLDNLGIEKPKVFRIETELGLENAKELFEFQLKKFIHNNGRISLGLLGLGTDGHTASIFNKNDAGFQKEYTLTINNQSGFDRVSVSSKLLAKIELIVFAVCGNAKKNIILNLINNPDLLPAGLALSGHQNVELWTDISKGNLYG